MKIGVVGSMHFAEEMQKVCADLKALGHLPLINRFIEPFLGKSAEERDKLNKEQKETLDVIRESWKDLESADAILVLNYDRHGVKNYIGGNSLIEMGYAHLLNKRIYLLNPIPEIPYYKSEIEAMQPIILKGNLLQIK